MIRRRLLLSAAAAALAGSGLAARSVAGPSPAKARLDALLTALVDEEMRRSPELVTQLGLDKDERGAAKWRLDDRSLAARARDRADNRDRLRRLRALDRRALGGTDAVSYDTVAFGFENQAEFDRRFDYADGPGEPYVISQLTGAYQSVPDFLDSQHTIETRADAQAYLARLEAFARAMDQEGEKARHDAGQGVIPPAFVIERALGQMAALRGQPAAAAPLVQSLVRRAKEKAIVGDWSGEAGRIYADKVVPALDRQIALMRALRAGAGQDAGVWRLPQGEAYYAVSLEGATTTTMSPAEIHQTGLDQVASLTGELDARLKAQGLSSGTVGARLRALYDDPRYRYPDTDDGRARLLAELKAKVAVVRARLPAWFGTLPRAEVEVRRLPPYLEAGGSTEYQQGSLDGSRPGIFYINLRDTAEVPSWSLPTVTYHEAIPGHHLQLSLQQEARLPLIRKVTWFSAYGEGWALYAEQLAAEMGLYEDDPMGRIGYLHDALLRAVRLVVDSGLHQMRWSREQGVRYYVEVLGDPEAAAVSEVERYCVWPGQACSYMVGKLTWLRLRERTRTALGSRFDIGAFHDAGLLPGAMPLTVLDRVIADYTRAVLA
ncbi:MAG: DUF885 family protein [Caulobacteraceae bacterium]|nr:DUF885 family protein [Caulobacteraceae bacterium]